MLGKLPLKDIFSLFLVLSLKTFSQVGIGTTTPRGILDVNSSTTGFIPPQVALTASNVAAPVTNPQGGAIVAGTMIYNTATAGVSPNNVIPGFYYWDGTKWLLLSNQNTASPNDWRILGNGGTSATTNFIGTTDAVDFVARTNNTEKVRVTSAGNVGIGTATPTATLDVNGTLRVQNIPATTTSSKILTTDTSGNIYNFSAYLLSDTDGAIATSPVDYTLSGMSTIDNINLGLSTTVTIPANKSCIIVISYSVPIGIANFPASPLSGYYGIRFLKNGVEADSGSRKSSIQYNANSACMTTISNTYVEKFVNGASPTTITYSLNGYLEQISAVTSTYRFNMWSATPPNFNWGRGTITKQVFIL